jgi:type IV secretion system protein VirB10
MWTNRPTNDDAMPPEPPGIVSVNSRGGKSTGMAAKFAFVILIIILLAVAGLLAYNRHRSWKNATERELAREAKVENKPAAVAARRTFNTDPPVDVVKPVGTASTAPTVLTDSVVCADGTSGRLMTSPDGQAILSPAKLPIRICSASSPIVPAVEPLPGDQLVSMETATNGKRHANDQQLPASRYGGDVLLPVTNVVPSGMVAGTGQDTALTHGTKAATPTSIDRRDALPSPHGRVSDLVRSDRPAAVTARLLGDRDMILPQGRSIDCNLSVRLISEISGKATCVLSSHAYSDNGKVILAERGSTAVGDYVALMAQGQRRLFVVWTQLRTPKGVVIDIDSPAADSLGTSGLPGYIDNRWPERIGAAFLLSLVDDVMAYETAKASRDRTGAGSGGNAQGIAVFQNSAETGSSLAERILENTINIKPTLYKQQGERATIFVSRDLDFGSVYALRAQ